MAHYSFGEWFCEFFPKAPARSPQERTGHQWERKIVLGPGVRGRATPKAPGPQTIFALAHGSPTPSCLWVK